MIKNIRIVTENLSDGELLALAAIIQEVCQLVLDMTPNALIAMAVDQTARDPRTIDPNAN